MQRDSALTPRGLLAHSLCVSAETSAALVSGQGVGAVSSDTSRDLTSVAWLFSCTTSCISCHILKTWSLLQIMSSFSSWARSSSKRVCSRSPAVVGLAELGAHSCSHHLLLKNAFRAGMLTWVSIPHVQGLSSFA